MQDNYILHGLTSASFIEGHKLNLRPESNRFLLFKDVNLCKMLFFLLNNQEMEITIVSYM